MKRLVWAVPVAVMSVVLAGCGSAPRGGSGTLHAVGELYPLSWVVEQVGGSRVSVDTLVAPGAEPHGYELSPQQITSIGRSDLAVYIRTLAASVDDGVASAPPKASIDAATLTRPRPAVDGGGAPTNAGGIDPHLWLDPTNLSKLADAVATQLSRLDPAGADAYTANAAALDARLAQLGDDYRSGLAHCTTTTLVITHPAFGYLTDQYGLTQVGVSGVDEDTEPSPARIVEVERIAAEAKVPTIFYPDTSNSKVADVIAGSLHLKTAQVSLILGAPPGGDYITAAEHNLSVLRAGLGCS